jgi:hypothetical protein
METESDDTLAAILACAAAIRPDDVEAELTAAMTDPLLQEIVERAVAPHEGKLTPDQLAESRQALALLFAIHPGAERLLDQIRGGGGKSHVVATGAAAAVLPEVAPLGGGQRRGSR